jgi:hypothetical protein
MEALKQLGSRVVTGTLENKHKKNNNKQLQASYNKEP